MPVRRSSIMNAIDLFAGWGGFTLGAEQAGVNVVWAANHWPLAVEAHALNHPGTAHACQDLRQADWTKLPRYELLLASPSCQGHSTASQPQRRAYHDAMRATAWAVVDCADATEPRAIIIENVPSFRQWRLYPVWRDALTRLGYHLSENIITASHHGVPQRRERLFIVATRKPAALSLTPSAEPAFGPCVEWDVGKWRSVKLASPGAQARIARGRQRLGQRFLSQHTTGHPGVGIDEPIRTITTKDQWIVVSGDQYRPLLKRELARGMGFPDTYSWPSTASREQVIAGLGNAVCPPVAKKIVGAVAAVC
jgi:DNA (cytosine-5)-methyltransferase 1